MSHDIGEERSRFPRRGNESERRGGAWKGLAIFSLIGLVVMTAFCMLLGFGLFGTYVAMRRVERESWEEKQALGELRETDPDDDPPFRKPRREPIANFRDKPIAGKPVETVMLGGLASFEVNQPRWKETTLDRTVQEYGYLEQVHYDFASGGAWLTVRGRSAVGETSVELEELSVDLAARIENTKVQRTQTRSLPCLEITGGYAGYQRLYRGTARVVDGVAVQIYMECLVSERQATEKDWQQVVKSLQLRSVAQLEEPLAYPIAVDKRDLLPDPNLAAFLGRATRVVSAARQHEVLAIAPDGRQAIETGSEGRVQFEDLTTHQLRSVAVAGFNRYKPITCAPDSRIILATDKEVLVLERKGSVRARFPIRAGDLACGRDRLLACTGTRDEPGLVRSNRLEEIMLDGGARHTLIDLPVGRLSRPAVSADGKQIALVIDRETEPFSKGHLHLCAADGSKLVQLTRELEQIHALAWSPDGKWLYAVRRLLADEKAGDYWPGRGDLYRISPQTGEAVNLTRCDHISMAWLAGTDVFLHVQGWELPEEQRGIFRIGLAELEKATAGQAAPAPQSPAERARKITVRVQAALGKTSPKEFVPTPELLAALAKAFAEAADEPPRQKLDFTPESLERLRELIYEQQQAFGREPAVVLGIGAYYGETLRKCAGAEWHIRPGAFGDWNPALAHQDNPLAIVVLPFSQPYAQALGAEEFAYMSRESIRRREQDQKLLLVYPPAFAAEALQQATSADYQKAMKLLEESKVPPALELLKGELQKRPRNQALALKVVGLYDQAGKTEAGDELAAQVLAAGCRSPELHRRLGDRDSVRAPEKALDHYRKSIEESWAASETYVKMGKAYAALGKKPLADACWRRAQSGASKAQLQELRSLIGLPKAEGE